MSNHTVGGIRRGPRLADNFTVMSNRVLNDENLSYRARGILVWLLSKPTNWSIRSEAIAAQSPSEGRTAVRTAMRELEEHGYLVREKVQNELGQWATIQTVYEEPVTSGNPSPEPKARKSNPGRPRDGQTGVFTKDGSPRTETNNNTSQAATSRVKVLGTDMLLSDAALEEINKTSENYKNLEVACAEAGLTARFDSTKPEQKTQILELIDQHGIPALVKRAQSLHNPENPTMYVQGWITAWKSLPPARSTNTSTPPAFRADKCADCEGTGFVINDEDKAVHCSCRKAS